MKIEILDNRFGIIRITRTSEKPFEKDLLFRFKSDNWWRSNKGIVERMSSCAGLEKEFQRFLHKAINDMMRFAEKKDPRKEDPSIEAAAILMSKLFHEETISDKQMLHGFADIHGPDATMDSLWEGKEFQPTEWPKSPTIKEKLLEKHGIKMAGVWYADALLFDPRRVFEGFPHDNSGATLKQINLCRWGGETPIETDAHHLELFRKQGVVRCEDDKWYIVD